MAQSDPTLIFGAGRTFALNRRWYKVPDEGRKDMNFHPHFLGIGAQRAGSTWLFHNLRKHRNLFLPAEKELHFFDHASRFERGVFEYERHFMDGRDRIRGEITPAYSILALDRIKFIKEYVPDLRIVFIVRNPIHRAWSHAVMALAGKRKRSIEEVSPTEILAHFQHRESLERGDYEVILSNWRSIFDSSQFFVGFFEDIVNRPKGLIREIVLHIGASADGIVMDGDGVQVHHKSSYETIPPQYSEFLMKLYRGRIERLLDVSLLGPRAQRWLEQ